MFKKIMLAIVTVIPIVASILSSVNDSFSITDRLLGYKKENNSLLDRFGTERSNQSLTLNSSNQFEVDKVMPLTKLTLLHFTNSNLFVIKKDKHFWEYEYTIDTLLNVPIKYISGFDIYAFEHRIRIRYNNDFPNDRLKYDEQFSRTGLYVYLAQLNNGDVKITVSYTIIGILTALGVTIVLGCFFSPYFLNEEYGCRSYAIISFMFFVGVIIITSGFGFTAL